MFESKQYDACNDKGRAAENAFVQATSHGKAVRLGPLRRCRVPGYHQHSEWLEKGRWALQGWAEGPLFPRGAHMLSLTVQCRSKGGIHFGPTTAKVYSVLKKVRVGGLLFLVEAH